MGNRTGAYGVLVGKSEGKRPLERPRHKFEDNIQMDLHDFSWEGQDWIDLAQTGKKVMGSCECSNEFLGSIKYREFLD